MNTVIYKPIFGIDLGSVPIYSIMMTIAFFAGLISLNSALKKLNFSPFMKHRVRFSFFVGSLFGVACANLSNWIWFSGARSASLFDKITEGGFTFYFGMLAFFAVSSLLLLLFKANVVECLNLIVRPLLLAHFFGRVGCCLRGCCYGAHIVLFGQAIDFPAREIEAVLLLVLFFVLKKIGMQKHFFIYIVSYSSLRFVLEFLRGDDRGSFFGLRGLSPTQVAALIVLVAAIALKIILIKVKKTDAPSKYSPRPNYYTDPKGRTRPLPTLLTVLICIVLFFSVFIFINPFNLGWVNDLRLGMSDSFGFLFDRQGYYETIGELDGVSLGIPSSDAPVRSDSEALALISSSDNWSDAQFIKESEKELPGGGKAYFFNQSVNGKPVIGSNRILVTDKNGVPLYYLGDSAELSYSKELSHRSFQTMNVNELIGADYQIVSEKEYLYNDGMGLTEVIHRIVRSKDGGSDALKAERSGDIGVIVDKNSGQVLAITPPQSGVISDIERSAAIKALENVIDLTKSENTAEMKNISHDTETPEDIDKERVMVERALCRAFEYSEMTTDQYADVLDSVLTVSYGSSSLNKYLLQKIMTAETERVLVGAGADRKTASDRSKAVDDAFGDCGINVPTDEKTVMIEPEKKPVKVTQTIGFDNDSDVMVVKNKKGCQTDVSLNTSTPVMVTFCNGNNVITSTYIEDSEQLSFSPEDGSEIIIRVEDVKTDVAPKTGTFSYSVSVNSVELKEEIPVPIRKILTRINDSYARSDLTSFLSLLHIETSEGAMPESFALIGTFAPVADSCASCVGLEDTLDTAKSGIAISLAPQEQNNDEFMKLRGTSLKLDYVSHVDYLRGYAIKASMQITLNDIVIYDGYTFILIEKIDKSEGRDKNEQEILSLFSYFNTDYHITDIDSSRLLALFGDNSTSLSGSSELDSLYKLCVPDERYSDIGDFIMKIPDNIPGYSEEKLNAFRKYVARNNIMSLKFYRSQLSLTHDLFILTPAVSKGAKDIYDLATNPIPTIATKLGDTKFKGKPVWEAIKFMTDVKGGITDMFLDELEEECFNQAAEIKKTIDLYDEYIFEQQEQYYSLRLTVAEFILRVPEYGETQMTVTRLRLRDKARDISLYLTQLAPTGKITFPSLLYRTEKITV